MSFVFQEELEAALSELGIMVTQEAKMSLESYFKELGKWKKKVNLIAKSASNNEIIDKHFVDSLALVPYLGAEDAHLLDIGTGGGFPGLVCKAALPGLKLTLVEPRLKRVSFLRHIVRTLRLENVEIRAKRLEEIPVLGEGHFSHITCRAVTEIGPFLDMVEGLSETGAEVILMKGPRWGEELKSSEEILAKSPFVYKNVAEYVLPGSGVRRALLFFKAR